MGKVVQFSGNDVQIRAHFVPIMGKDVQKRAQSSKTRSLFAIPLGATVPNMGKVVQFSGTYVQKRAHCVQNSGNYVRAWGAILDTRLKYAL
jgi:hypothetical protein